MGILRRFMLLIVLLLAAACEQAAPPAALPDPTAIQPPASTPTPAVSPTPRPTATPTLQASLRIVHAAPDAPTVNFYAGPLAIATNLRFGSFTDPTPVDVGDQVIRVVPSGSRSGAPALLEIELPLTGRDSLLLILAGTQDNLELLQLPEPVVALNAGESAITLIHALPNAPEFSLYRDNRALAAASFGQASSPAVLPAGVDDLQLRGGPAPQTFAEESRSQVSTLLVIAGSPAEPDLIRVSARAPGYTALRVINAASAAPAVDVYLDDRLLAAAVEYGRAAPRQPVITGAHMLRLYAAGADTTTDQPLASQAIAVEAVEHSALFILGSRQPLLTALYPEDLSPTPPREARLALVNTLDAFPRIQVQTGSEVLAEANYGERPAQIALPDGQFNFHWLAAGGAAVEIVENIQLRAGFSYLYLVTGRLEGSPVIFSDNVGTDAALEGLTDPAAGPAYVRLVNATSDREPLEFLLNEVPLMAVDYGQGTELLAWRQHSPTVGVLADGQTLEALEVELSGGRRYTIVAYGSRTQAVKILLLPDADLVFGGSAPRLRFINASLDPSISLGLGYSVAEPAIENEPSGEEEPTVEDFRRSIPIGLYRLAENIAGGAPSGIILMTPGTHNLQLLDSDRAELAKTLPFIELRPGAHYDVIAYQEHDSPRVQGFVLEYPPRSD